MADFQKIVCEADDILPSKTVNSVALSKPSKPADTKMISIPEFLNVTEHVVQIRGDVAERELTSEDDSKKREQGEEKRKDGSKKGAYLPPEIMGQISKFLPKPDKMNFRLASKDMAKGVAEYFKLVEGVHGDAVKRVFTSVEGLPSHVRQREELSAKNKSTKCFMISAVKDCVPGLALSVRVGDDVFHLQLAPSIRQLKTPLLRLDITGLEVVEDVRKGSPEEEKKIIQDFFKKCILDEKDLIIPFPTLENVKLNGKRAYGNMLEDTDLHPIWLDLKSNPLRHTSKLTTIQEPEYTGSAAMERQGDRKGQVNIFPTYAHEEIAKFMAEREKSESPGTFFFVCFYPCGLLPSWQIVTTQWRCRAYPYCDLEHRNPFQYSVLVQNDDEKKSGIQNLLKLFQNSNKKPGEKDPTTISEVITFLAKKGGFEMLENERKRGLDVGNPAAAPPTVTLQTAGCGPFSVVLTGGRVVDATLVERMFGVRAQSAFLQDVTSGVFTTLARVTPGHAYVLHTRPL
eukprot:CAMPEP_0177631506 /NCGR_PEP_ID=MMETSP0447-20121125/1787_1 /TAXON_ID=0 /ORGANISM="Stygamoeba regulata, Strain BSH-02190019" /LENGTH=513 /DNA_ID=CAMNT_0019132997 /DNA_START=23 /DNA_END=1565 /DNA_ORIENTATION=+